MTDKGGFTLEQYKVLTDERLRYPIGLTVTEKKLHISVIGAKESCCLVLYDNKSSEPCQKIPMNPADKVGDVWNLTIVGKWPKGTMYCLEMDGELKPDPCGRQFIGWEKWGEPENIKKVLKSPLYEEDFDWEDDKSPEIPFHETIIYRCHVRGMSCHSSSRGRNKGTFRALMEKIPYIKELGATTVELMPVNEFQEVMVQESEWNPRGVKGPEPTGKLNYWGYTGGYYYAPKASYSSGQKKHPAHEFKTLVKAFHREGMELIIELYFSGKESPAFVLDVVRFWAEEYHVDGIHLVGYAPIELIGRDSYLSSTKLFATSWNGIDGGDKKHLAEYNDGFLTDMRRVLKGDEDQIHPLIFRISGNPKRYGMINYMAHTNGFTMMDMVSYDQKHNEENGEQNRDGSDYNFSWNCGLEGVSKKKKLQQIRFQQIRNAMVLLFLSQGTPLLLAGDEFGNSKGGNNNTYCQDNEISWLNWNQKRTNQEIYQFAKYMIQFRKDHPVFHMEHAPQNMDYLACGHPDMSYHGVKAWRPEYENFRRQLGVLYCGEYGKREDGSFDDYFFVMYNMHWEPHEFGLPHLPRNRRWYVAIDTSLGQINGYYEMGNEPLLEEQNRYMVKERSIVVLMGKLYAEKVEKSQMEKESNTESKEDGQSG